MTWLDAVPAQAVAAALLLVPGLLVGLAGRLRGTWLLGTAPAVSTALLGASALVAPTLGWAWGWRPVAVATAATAVVAAVVGRVLLRGPTPDGPAERRAAGAAVAAGAAAAALALLSVRRGLGRPDMVSQSFDALFQLNAVRWILDHGDASPLHISAMSSPESVGFYPAGWHALTSLVAQLSGASPVVAANAVTWVVAGVAWPLAAALLVRALVGPRPLAVAAGALLSQGFASFPWLLDRWGVLWPQALGTALAPAVLALLVGLTAVGATRADRLRRLLVAGVALGGTGLAHPGVVFLLLPLVTALLLVSALPAVLLPWRSSTGQRVITAATVVAGLVAAVGVVAVWPRTASLRAFDWPATRSVGRAVLEDLLGSPAGAGGSVAVAVLVLVGVVVAARRTRWRWLVVGWVLLIALDVLAAAVDAPISRQLTGLWYNDRYRLASAVPLTALPLAVLGAGALARGLAGRVRPRPALGAALAVLVLAAVVVPQVRGNGDQLGLTNARAAESVPQSYVGLGEQRFLEGLSRYVPAGDVVIGNPWDGSSFAYALGGVEVLYPHLTGRWPGDWYYLADNLQLIGTDPAVCAALDRTRVRWFLDDGTLFHPAALTPFGFTAMRQVQDLPQFTEVASGGGATLYRITGCA